MGCGQSKIHLYPRKSKSKSNGKKSGHIDTDADADEDEGHIEEGSEKDINRDKDKIEDENSPSDGKGSPEPPNGEISISLLRAKNLSLLQSQEISTSQQNFFRMLDKKIEEGPDYDSSSETEIALEEARLNTLVQHWESASLTASLCSSASRSLQTTPVRQVPIRASMMMRPAGINPIQTQPLSAELLPHHSTHQQGGMIITAAMSGVVGQQMTYASQQQHQQQQQQQYQQQQQLQHSQGQQLHAQQQLQQSQQHHMLQQQHSSLVGGVMIGSPQTHLLTTVAGQKNNMVISPKRAGSEGMIRPMQLSQSIIHQNYGISPPQTTIAGRQRSVSVTGPTSGSAGPPPGGGMPSNNVTTTAAHQLQMAYYGQPTSQPTPPQTYFGEVLHPMQVPQTATEYRFPPAISVQRLAPQVQRQLRETQELIKDSCPQLYSAGYGSPGPPLRTQPRNSRRPTLETQYSQELS